MHDADGVTCRTACCNNATDAADLRLFGLKVRHGANASARSNNEGARARAKASAPLPCGHDDMTCRPAACRPWPFHAPCALRRRRVSRMPITHTVGIGDPLDPTCNFGEQGSRARAQRERFSRHACLGHGGPKTPVPACPRHASEKMVLLPSAFTRRRARSSLRLRSCRLITLFLFSPSQTRKPTTTTCSRGPGSTPDATVLRTLPPPDHGAKERGQNSIRSTCCARPPSFQENAKAENGPFFALSFE